MRLLVLSKHSVIRSALRHLFTSTEEVEVVGEAEGATKAEEIITRAFPDVVLVETVETTSPAMLQLVDKLRSLGNIPIVILTNDSSPRAARAMFRAGVTGYVLKESADTDLVSALRSANRGPEVPGSKSDRCHCNGRLRRRSRTWVAKIKQA